MEAPFQISDFHQASWIMIIRSSISMGYEPNLDHVFAFGIARENRRTNGRCALLRPGWVLAGTVRDDVLRNHSFTICGGQGVSIHPDRRHMTMHAHGNCNRRATDSTGGLQAGPGCRAGARKCAEYPDTSIR